MLVGVALLVLYARYPTVTTRLFQIDRCQRDEDDVVRQLYNYSPGPLRIDTVSASLSASVTLRIACYYSVAINKARPACIKFPALHGSTLFDKFAPPPT